MPAVYNVYPLMVILANNHYPLNNEIILFENNLWNNKYVSISVGGSISMSPCVTIVHPKLYLETFSLKV